MTIESLRRVVERAVFDSKFQIDFIDNDNNGGLIVKVSRLMKYDYPRSIKGCIRGEEDIGKFIGVLSEN